MPGSVATAGIIAGVVGLSVALGAVAAASVHAQRVASAADAAALAAADAASGAIAGIPCARAGEVAASTGATVEECVVDGLIATVRVSSPFGVWPVAATARAGPPPGDR